MKNCKSLLSLLLIVSLLIGILPSGIFSTPVHAAGDGTVTNSATAVDLDALMAIIDDDTDSNKDGLPDELCRILGLNPDLDDSNGDGLTDKFKLDNGLDPLKADTYDIGITDLYALTKGNADLPLTSDLLNVDTDGDGTPDIRDKDIDGDKVPNASDISPFSFMSASDSQTITLKTSGKAVNVKLQVQPGDINNLKDNSRIMTWPIDTLGQMNNIDDSKDNVKIVPMLEVDLPEALSEDEIDEWGYVYFNNQLFLPLQYVMDDYEPVALSAELYLPEGYGTVLDSSEYQVDITFRLSWLMVAQAHDLSAQWEPYAKIQTLVTTTRPVYTYDFMGQISGIDHWEEYQYWRDVTLEDFTITYENELLGSSISNRNNNNTPDVTVFWYNGKEKSVYEIIYYDLTYDSEAGVYKADSQYEGTVYQFDYIENPQNHIEWDDSARMNRVHNAQYIINQEGSKSYTAYYTAYDGYIEVTPNFKSGFAADPFNINGMGYFTEKKETLDFWWWEQQQYSYIRDAAYIQVPDDHYPTLCGEIWYIFEAYNPNLGCNEISLLLQNESASGTVTTSKVLLSGLKADPDTRAARFSIKDLDKALALDIHDVNKDEVDDLMFTTRDGRMFYIEDFRADTNWTDRMYELPDGRDSKGVFSQSTRYHDFNNDGTEELVSVQAIRMSDYHSTDLYFQVSTKEDITRVSKILMKDTVPFTITGVQANEHESLDTTLLAGDHTEDLVYMASLMQHYYLQGNRSMAEAVDAYISDVLDNNAGWLYRSTASYSHVYEALLDIGKQIDSNETWKAYDGPQPLLILTRGKERLKNMDETGDTDRVGNHLKLTIPSDKTVINKQMIVKWHDDGATLSQDGITDMVQGNPAGLYEFRADPAGALEVLGAWNMGTSEIIGIGDAVTEAESFNALKLVLSEWKNLVVTKNVITKIPVLSSTFHGQLFKIGITKFIKPNMLNFASSSIAYKAELAKYNNMMGNYRKVGAAINCAGILIDVGVSVYSGYLYGKNMAEVGGTAYGIATGVTYGSIVLATSLFTTYLVSLGPVGWVAAAAIVGDSLLAGMITNYSGTVTLGVMAIMKVLYSSDTYTGTQLMSIENSDNEENNKTETTGMDYGVVVLSRIRQVQEQDALIRANSQNSPANDYYSLADSKTFIYVSYSGSAIKNYTKEERSWNVYQQDGFWYNNCRSFNDDTIEFLKAGMNIPVVHTTTMWTRLIGSVTVNRYAIYTTTDEKVSESSYIDSVTIYYDVLPRSLAELWQVFPLVPDGQIPHAANNELSYKDPYLDSDGDGVPDLREEGLGLNSESTDTDNDGLTDYYELKYGFDPLLADTDDDSIGDYEECMNRYAITITTSLGSVSAQIKSDPTKSDTDGDGLSDMKERENDTNAASLNTHGSRLYDGNAHPPVLLQEFTDQNVLDGTTLTYNLAEYFSDEDGDTLEYKTDYGTISDDGILTYTFDPFNDGAIVEITVSACDQKGGYCEDAFQVYDTTKPLLESIQATYPDDLSKTPVTPLVLTEFEDELYTNPTFVLRFNKRINFDSINSSAITMTPIENADLDIDWSLVQHRAAVSIEQVDNYTIEITRSEPIVENAIKYRLDIPAAAIMDNSDQPMEQDFTTVFYTGDHVSPWLISVSDVVDINTPLILTFSEDVVLTGDQTISFFLETGDANGTSRYYTPRGEQTGNRTIEIAIRPNFLDDGTSYFIGDPHISVVISLHQNTAKSNDYTNIKDKYGNILYHERTLSKADRMFTTGDVTGPEIMETLNVFASDPTYQPYENWYNVEAEINGEIRIDWSENVYKGDGFDGIFLLHGDAAGYWLNSVSIVERNELKTLAVRPKTCRIEGNTLIITPPDYLAAAGVSIDVFIPNSAILDSSGLSIYDRRRPKERTVQDITVPDNRSYYISVVSSTSTSSIQKVEQVITLADRSNAGIILALCGLPEQVERKVAPGNTLTALATVKITDFYADGVSLWKVLDDASEVQADYQSPDVVTTEENPNLSRFITIDLNEPMLAGETYVLKIADGAIGTNPYQELFFTVGDYPLVAFGVNILTTRSVDGILRVGEEVSTVSGFKNYYDKINGTLTYQWYTCDTNNQNTAQAIPGATSQIYVLQSSDEGKHLFLKITADTTAWDSQIDNPYVRWGSSVSTYMTQSMGIVEAAFMKDCNLADISVMETGDETTELLEDFSSAVTRYDLEVPVGMESVRVKASAGESGNSSVYINNCPSEDWTGRENNGEAIPDGLDIRLNPGINKVIIRVVAEDTRETKEYDLFITRGHSTDADASQLKPQAWRVDINNSKEAYTGQTLVGDYVIYDYLGREESGTSYQWYRYSDGTTSNKTIIPGATGRTYILTDEDIGKYIAFEVTPRVEGSISGSVVLSLKAGMVTATDDLISEISNIEIIYSGSNLLNDFSADKKVYPIIFSLADGQIQAEIIVTGGSNVTINGASGNTATVDLGETTVVEVTADTGGPEQTSYYVLLDSQPQPEVITVNGGEEVTVDGSSDASADWETIVYDQYGDVINKTIDWTVPAGLSNSQSGLYRQYINFMIPASASSETYAVTAAVSSAKDVSVEKILTVIVIAASIQGETRDVAGTMISGVTISTPGSTPVESNSDGIYVLTIPVTGTYTVVAHKNGFRDEERNINVSNLSDVYSLNFRGDYGLIPNTPNLSYVLACINKWKYPSDGLGLDLSKVLAVINAWKFPVE